MEGTWVEPSPEDEEESLFLDPIGKRDDEEEIDDDYMMPMEGENESINDRGNGRRKQIKSHRRRS